MFFLPTRSHFSDGSPPRDAMPPLLASWRAHDSAVVSLEIVEHPVRKLILTASTDTTAKVWTTDGSIIGEKKGWCRGKWIGEEGGIKQN